MDEAGQARKRGRRVYTMRELSLPPQTTLAEYLIYLSDHPEKADAKLRPGEKWAISIYGNNILMPLDSASQFAGYLDRYQGLMQNAVRPEMLDEMIKNVRIVKVGRPLREGEDMERHEERLEELYREKLVKQKQEREKVEREAIKLFPTQERKEGRKPSKAALLKSALEQNKTLAEKLQELSEKFGAIQKQAKKAAPKKKRVSEREKELEALVKALSDRVQKLEAQKPGRKPKATKKAVPAKAVPAKPAKKAVPAKPAKKAAPTNKAVTNGKKNPAPKKVAGKQKAAKTVPPQAKAPQRAAKKATPVKKQVAKPAKKKSTPVKRGRK